MPELLSNLFVLWYPAIIASLITGALLIRRRFPDLNVGMATLMLWSTVINLSFVFDYFELPAEGVLLFVFGFVAMLFFGTRPSGPESSQVARTEIAAGARLFLAWCLGALFLILPLFVVYPPDTLVTGHFVNNDIVSHSAMMRGYGHTRGLAALTGMDSYPRAFQSFAYYANALFFGSVPIPYFVVPLTAFAYSFIVFALHPLLEETHASGSTRSVLLLSVACAPFLTQCATYLLFVSQAASLPLVLGASSAILTFSVARNVGIQLFSIATISIAALATYGLFSLSLLVAVLAVRLLASYTSPTHTSHPVRTRDSFRELIPLPWAATGAIIAVAALVLSLGQMLELLIGLLSPHRSENVIAASGTHGFLSFGHLTGLWPPGDYRSAFTSETAQYAFAILLAIQVLMVVSKLGKTSLALLLVTIAAPMMASRLITGPYIHFKYLTVWVACFPFACAVSFTRSQGAQTMRDRFLATTLVVGFTACILFFPMRGHKAEAIVTSSDWRALELLDSEVLQRGATLVLTREDWIQYFIDPKDDLAPLTQYLQRPSGQVFPDYAVLDSHYVDFFHFYLESNPSLRERLAQAPHQCRRLINDRFEVVRMSCPP